MLSQTPLWVTIVLVLLVLLVFAYCYLKTAKSNPSLKPPLSVLNLEEYDYIEDPGFYIHKVTKRKICGKCADQNKLKNLSFHAEKGLICRRCGESYVSPYDYKSTLKQANINK